MGVQSRSREEPYHKWRTRCNRGTLYASNQGGLPAFNHLSDLTLTQHQIQASGARIEYFNELQIQCGISIPLKIPLHSNVRWGTAHTMLDRGDKLRQVSHSLPFLRLPLTQYRQSPCSLCQRMDVSVPSLQFAGRASQPLTSHGRRSHFRRPTGRGWLMPGIFSLYVSC